MRRHLQYWRGPIGRLHLWLLPETGARMYSLSSFIIVLGSLACGQELGRLPQPRRRPDLVEAFPHFKCRQLLALQQIGVQLSKIASFSSRQTAKRVGAKDSESVVDVTHARGAVCLAVRENRSCLELDVARVPLSLIAKDCHHSQDSCRLEAPGDGSVVARKIGITVHNKKRLP